MIRLRPASNKNDDCGAGQAHQPKLLGLCDKILSHKKNGADQI
jgi:hypothetical protein